MKISQLISILGECDPDANVFLMHQRNYPLESTLYGVTVREDFSDDGSDGRSPNDVVLLEGTERGYAARLAWASAKHG